MGIAPLFAALAPIEVIFSGWRPALIHLSFALLLSLVLLNLLLVWFRKIPFTCSYFPGKTSMAVMFFVYLAGFSVYAWTMADLEQLLAAGVHHEFPAHAVCVFENLAHALIDLGQYERAQHHLAAAYEAAYATGRAACIGACAQSEAQGENEVLNLRGIA